MKRLLVMQRSHACIDVEKAVGREVHPRCLLSNLTRRYQRRRFTHLNRPEHRAGPGQGHLDQFSLNCVAPTRAATETWIRAMDGGGSVQGNIVAAEASD